MTRNAPLPLTDNAVAYALRQLAIRAGLSSPDLLPRPAGFECAGVPVFYARPDDIPAGQASITIVPCDSRAWDQLLQLEPGALDWVPLDEVLPPGITLPVESLVPVLFWGGLTNGEGKRFVELRPDGSLVFHADIIAAALFMLTRWEETVSSTLDRYARFPAEASAAYRQGFLDRPIIDEYALIFRAWLRCIQPSWQPEEKQFSVLLSHDIDAYRRVLYPMATARSIGSAILKQRNLRLTGELLAETSYKLRDSFQYVMNPKNTPYYRGIKHLAELSGGHGLRSAFYFMASEPGDPFNLGNGYYPDEPAIREAINSLQTKGFEIGFHASYDTLGNPERLINEKKRLEQVLGYDHFGGRQHFLRFRAPDTWRHWEEAGLAYDSTLAYADHEGFRCGTCHPYYPFDLEHDRLIDVLELPLIVMDGTLSKYRQVTPIEGEAIISTLARRCKSVGGTFTLLWHNSSLDRSWQPWFQMYQRLLPWLASLRETGPDSGIVDRLQGPESNLIRKNLRDEWTSR